MKHVTRYSDSSMYDRVCILCGAVDGPFHQGLNGECAVTDPNVREQIIQKEEDRKAYMHAEWVRITGKN